MCEGYIIFFSEKLQYWQYSSRVLRLKVHVFQSEWAVVKLGFGSAFLCCEFLSDFHANSMAKPWEKLHRNRLKHLFLLSWKAYGSWGVLRCQIPVLFALKRKINEFQDIRGFVMFWQNKYPVQPPAALFRAFFNFTNFLVQKWAKTIKSTRS